MFMCINYKELNMKLKKVFSIGLSTILLTASVQGASWSTTQNKHGFVFKSNNKTLYLGRGCDAMSPQYGKGEWYWNDNNEVVVSLSNKDFTFNSGSLYEDGRCKKEISSGSQSSSGISDSDKVALVGTALVIGGLIKLFSSDSDSSSSSSSSSYSSSSDSTRTYTCKYSCISDVGLLYETYRDIGSIEISGSSYSDVKNKADEIAEKKCKSTLDKHGYKMRYGSTSCD